MTRAYVASIGAGMALVAAAMTALFLLSAVVAVRGWPGMDPDDDVATVELVAALPAPSRGSRDDAADASAPGAVAVAASAPIVLGAGPAGTEAPEARAPRERARRTARRGAAPRPEVREPESRRGREDSTDSAPLPAADPPPPAADRGSPSPSGDAPRSPAGSGGGATPPTRPQPSPAPTAPAAPAPAAPRPGVAGQVTGSAGKTVRDAGAAAGGAVQQVGSAAPGPVGDVVTGVGQAVPQVTDRVGGTITDAGGAVDEVVKGNLPGAVEKLTGALDKLLAPPPKKP